MLEKVKRQQIVYRWSYHGRGCDIAGVYNIIRMDWGGMCEYGNGDKRVYRKGEKGALWNGQRQNLKVHVDSWYHGQSAGK